ncbi:sigma-70 family RNA polymerase sigma factor [Candidatus Kuenenbacteria bacterium]|nr:sigma-70 family RNA polymerase sigma factor [Candidatus Kuenenbacteria bacterium]
MVTQESCIQLSDNELVALSLKSADYFACLIKRYERQLLVYVRRISGLGQEDAEDVLQEVFIKIFYNLNDFDDKLKFSSWAYRIAHNETVSELRKRQARPQIILDDEEWQKITADTDLNKEINTKYDRAMLEKIISRLGEKYREIFILRFVEELDYREISDILRLPVSTVGTLIARARRKFKEEFIKINPEYYEPNK